MFWPAFGWHGAGLGCFCLVSGWCEAVPDAIWLVPQQVDGNRLFFGWRDAGGGLAPYTLVCSAWAGSACSS